VDFADSESCANEDDLEPASRIVAIKLLNKITGKSYAIPERTYKTEDPKKRFGIGVGFKTVFLKSEEIKLPVFISATQLGPVMAENKGHMGISIEPFYDISKYVTFRTAIQFAERKVKYGTTDPSSNTHYDPSGMETQYIGGFAAIQLNAPFKGFSPYVSAGFGYLKTIGRNTYKVTYLGTDYEFTPNKVDMRVYRLIFGVTMEMSSTVDIVANFGYDRTINSPYYDGFEIKRKDGTAVNPALKESANNFQSPYMEFCYFYLGVNFRIF
jgi:hypothetical protein